MARPPGHLHVTCPLCRQQYPVPARVIQTEGHEVIVAVDRSEVYGHLQRCAGQDEPGKALEQSGGEGVSRADLAGRIGLMLDQRAYVAKGGSRACTMCGTNGDVCMSMLRHPLDVDGAEVRRACCDACWSGNTHPAPGEAKGTCQQWAEAREDHAQD